MFDNANSPDATIWSPKLGHKIVRLIRTGTTGPTTKTADRDTIQHSSCLQ